MKTATNKLEDWLISCDSEDNYDRREWKLHLADSFELPVLLVSFQRKREGAGLGRGVDQVKGPTAGYQEQRGVLQLLEDDPPAPLRTLPRALSHQE